MRNIAVAFVVFLIAGCGSAAPATHTITGTLRFEGLIGPATKGECKGWDNAGTADLTTGMQILVVDEADKTIGTGRLTNTSTGFTGAGTCSGSFSVTDVPDAAFYEAHFGIRKTEQYAKADLEARGWKLDLVIKAQ